MDGVIELVVQIVQKKTGVSAERDLLRFFSQKYYAKRLCLHCYELYMRDYNKMHKALYSRTEVRYFSKNYQGNISTTGEHFGIGTRYYANRDIAMEELKILARYLDCDAIIEGDFDWQEKEEETENENGRISRYRYKVWAYAGVAVRLVNKKNKI